MNDLKVQYPAMTRTEPTPPSARGADAPTLLQADMDAALTRYARTRDPRTRAALILHHQPLVRFVAARFRDAREPLEDLIQVGTLGLIKAVDGYDPARGVKFSAYAMPTILGEIKRHFRDRTWHVKVPRWLQERALAARKVEHRLAARLGRTPTVREVAAELGLSEDEALEALGLHEISGAVSLDSQLDAYGGGKAATLADVIGQIDAALRDVDAYTDLRRAMSRLEEREASVVHLRFFEDLSQTAIAQRLNVSQMQVSRLERRAMERLRDILTDNVKPRR